MNDDHIVLLIRIINNLIFFFMYIILRSSIEKLPIHFIYFNMRNLKLPSQNINCLYYKQY